MIRRTLTPILAALVLSLSLAACQSGQTPTGSVTTAEDTAVQFITAFQSGDEAGACELADRKIGDCTTRPSIEFTEEPAAGDTFQNDETGTTAVIVTYTAAERPDQPYTYAVEVKKDGKVTAWEDMSGQPKNRNTVAMVLEWSE